LIDTAVKSYDFELGKSVFQCCEGSWDRSSIHFETLSIIKWRL